MCAILHSITNSGLILGRQNSSRDRQTGFFTAVKSHAQESSRSNRAWSDHTTSCILQERGKGIKTRCAGKIYSLLNVKDWSSIKQDRTQSSSTIHSQLIVSRKHLWWNLKKSYTKKCMCHLDHSRRFPVKIIGRVIWILMLQEPAKTSNESNLNQMPNYQVQADLYKMEWRNPGTYQVWSRHSDNVTDPTSTRRPACGHESTERCVLTPEHVERDQTSTVRPVTVDQKEEHSIEFRVPRLSHSVVKEAEHLRVQELVQRIENHPHRAALPGDLQQNNVYNPFSKNSKEMIHELGNVEFVEVCETTPKVKCSQCLLAWFTANPEESLTN